MNDHERQVIDSLFARLRQVEGQSPPRDREAEQLIADRLRARPAAAYYLAQTVIAQDQALEVAQARMIELERELYSRGGGGFLSGLSGGREHRHRSSPHQTYRAGAWVSPGGVRRYGYGTGVRTHPPGGSFLAGAAQTAMGVAGGMMVAGFIADAFMGSSINGNDAMTETGAAAGSGPAPSAGADPNASADPGVGDSDFGGEEFPGGGFDFDEF